MSLVFLAHIKTARHYNPDCLTAAEAEKLMEAFDGNLERLRGMMEVGQSPLSSHAENLIERGF